MNDTPALVLGLSAAVILVGGWIGFPLVLKARIAWRGLRPPAEPVDPLPPLTVIIATRDAPATIERRLANLDQCTYPHGLVTVVIGIDPSGPYPIQSYGRPGGLRLPTTFVPGDAPGGKAATLNAAVRVAQTECLIFTDSAQSFEPGTLVALARAIDTPGVGGATGKIITNAERGVMALYMAYEGMLRTLESQLRCVVAVTGAIHALRRSCWSPLPAGLICDDLLIPLRTARGGLGTVYEPAAVAYDPRPLERSAQVDRKIRTLTGMLQVCVWEPWVLFPGRNPNWLAFVGHKLVRLGTPWLVLTILGAVALLVPVSALLATLVVALVAIPLVALSLRISFTQLWMEATGALRLLAAPIFALRNALRSDWGGWRTHGTMPPT